MAKGRPEPGRTVVVTDIQVLNRSLLYGAPFEDPCECDGGQVRRDKPEELCPRCGRPHRTVYVEADDGQG